MNPKRPRNRQPGQGLVEFALILLLVTVVVIVAFSLLSQAVQRVYGVIGGALGANYNAVGEHSVEIATAECIALKSAKLTGLWVTGYTNEDVANLTGSTDQAVGTGMAGLVSPVEANGVNGFKFHPLLLDHAADLSVCPKSVVIQSTDGAIAVSPVTAVIQP